MTGDAFFDYQLGRYGCTTTGPPTDFTTALCETPEAVIVHLYEDVPAW